MPNGPPTRHLCVRLLKLDVTDFANAMKRPGDLDSYDLRDELPFTGQLFLRRRFPRNPPWFLFVASGVTDALPDLRTASNAAVLFVRAGGRVFVITYGVGRHLLRPGATEPDFGLRTALNVIEPDSLRSVDSHSLEELTVHKRAQSSRVSGLDVFGIDVQRDVLRAATGVPRDTTFGSQITGAEDMLALNPKLEFESLGDRCAALLEAYGSIAYRDRFDFIDHLRRISDPTQVDSLNDTLVQRIRDGTHDRLYLAPPEAINWTDLEGFSFTRQNREFRPDLRIEDYVATLRPGTEADLQRLKSDQVFVWRAEYEEPMPHWTVYKCLICEIDEGDDLFVLTGGRWFAVATDFAGQVRHDVLAVDESALALPDAQPREVEQHYNERAAATNADFELFDRRNLRCASTSTPMELCDIFTANRQFVHVKPRKGGSSTLSHLFAQGRNAAEAFLGDHEFRRQAHDVLAERGSALLELIPEGRPNPAEFEIIYAIIENREQTNAASLPFFSQLTLRNAVVSLRTLGYRASIRLVARLAAEE